jgi:hypothetical protein
MGQLHLFASFRCDKRAPDRPKLPAKRRAKFVESSPFLNKRWAELVNQKCSIGKILSSFDPDGFSDKRCPPWSRGVFYDFNGPVHASQSIHREHDFAADCITACTRTSPKGLGGTRELSGRDRGWRRNCVTENGPRASHPFLAQAKPGSGQATRFHPPSQVSSRGMRAGRPRSHNVVTPRTW